MQNTNATLNFLKHLLLDFSERVSIMAHDKYVSRDKFYFVVYQFSIVKRGLACGSQRLWLN